MSKLFRDFNPFELEARTKVDKLANRHGFADLKFYFGQFELKARVDTLRELRDFADQFGGDVEEDLDYDTFRHRGVKVFTVVNVEGIKVHVCAYLSLEEAEAGGFC